MTTERDLIQRMADELDHYRQLLMDDLRETHALANEARAYLAQPEPEGPTDEELNRLLYYEFTTSTGHGERSDPIGFARAVLTRWGSPAIEPVPVSGRPWEREGWCDADGRCWWGRPSEEMCNSDWFLATRAEVEEFCDCSPPVVSLPHHALPVPQP
jgi:hypothetical protein